MKKINYKEFEKEMNRMIGSNTCIVMNNQYSWVEVDDTLLSDFLSEEITEESLDENSEITSIMLQNFSVEMAPANNVQDDEYMKIVRDCFSVDSKLFSAKKDDEIIYVLCYN